jgi:transposase
MPRFSTLVPHLTAADIDAHYRHADSMVTQRQWHLLRLMTQGYRLPAAARLVGFHPDWARTVVRRYNADGAAGITDRRQTNPGHPPLLTVHQRQDLQAALADAPPDGGLWTGPKVAAWMSEQLGHPVRPQRGWEAIRTLGFTLQRPRPHDTKADPVAQEAFKKGGLPPA